MPQAVNIGDGLHARMWAVLLGNREALGHEKTLAVLGEFANMVAETVEGQTYELGWIQKKQWDIDERDYYNMTGKKTSWYTVITPCRLGGVIAGAGRKTLDSFVTFGMPMGIAFQIQDDLLNLLVEPEKYGKEIAGDIWEGKRTLVLIHLLKSCPKAERARIISIMEKPREGKTAKEVEYVLGQMKGRGSIDYAKQRAREFALKAKSLFDAEFGAVPEGAAKDSIKALIDYVINREY
jgi:geranylgeranyl diphosphate synthase type II